MRDKVVIFDGVCGLCNASVNLLMRLDKKKTLRYTSLQGEYVKQSNIEKGIDSIVYVEQGIVYYKSTAILKILKSLGGIWVFINAFYLIPVWMRDFIYDVIAKYRYSIFGKMQSCRMPRKEEEELFID
ncbi:MAG TPA: DUF393 domain-containing protein [Epsilonproteobacteria bacterium]|nr:DUF393 domain-containing protein [Campylobacterota bacterium]